MKFQDDSKHFWYIAIATLALILIVKLIQLSKMIYLFPSDDFSSHITNLFFLKEYGFHNIAPNWYNGMVILRYYPPLLSFFGYLIYSVINNVQLAFYLSILGIIVIGFFGIYLLGNILNLSKIKRLFLFLFFYSNPLTIPWFYIIGRVPEMLAWTLVFYLLALLFYYKDKNLDKKFFIFLTVILTLILLAHPLILTLSLFLVFGLFLIKNNKEKLKIIISLIIVPILSAFWLIDFIKHMNILQYAPSNRLYIHPTEVIYSILIPLIFLGIFYLYLKIKRIKKKELLFYLPIVFISILYITHLFLYIPFIKSIEPRTYGILLITISMILILHLRPNKKALKLISIGILILSLIITLIYFTKYNSMEYSLYNEKNIEILNLLPLVKEKFIVIEQYGDINKGRIYAFSAVNYNLTTPLGWEIQETSKEIMEVESNTKEFINNEDCESLMNILENLGVKEVIAHQDKCSFLQTCGLNEKERSKLYCLLSTNT